MVGERLTMLKVGRLRSIVEQAVPHSILRMGRNLSWASIRQRYGRLSVAEAFTQTYRNKLWGNVNGEKFFSGRGSLDEFSAAYVEWVTKFVTERNIRTVVDLGCGDFRIGQQICATISVNYIGVDIVADLIAHNQSEYVTKNISFKCANIIEDELPNGELCLLRQVLQHLSNKQILSVLANCTKFPYLLVTEGVYNGRRMRPNLDIMHGPDSRLFKRSGVCLDLAPFNLKTRNVLEIPRLLDASVIRTCLIEGRAAPAARD
jgi:hypothetical protein